MLVVVVMTVVSCDDDSVSSTITEEKTPVEKEEPVKSTTLDKVRNYEIVEESVVMKIKEVITVRRDDYENIYDVVEFSLSDFPRDFFLKGESLWIETSEDIFCYDFRGKVYKLKDGDVGEEICGGQYSIKISTGTIISFDYIEDIVISFVGDRSIDFFFEYKKVKNTEI